MLMINLRNVLQSKNFIILITFIILMLCRLIVFSIEFWDVTNQGRKLMPHEGWDQTRFLVMWCQCIVGLLDFIVMLIYYYVVLLMINFLDTIFYEKVHLIYDSIASMGYYDSIHENSISMKEMQEIESECTRSGLKLQHNIEFRYRFLLVYLFSHLIIDVL